MLELTHARFGPTRHSRRRSRICIPTWTASSTKRAPPAGGAGDGEGIFPPQHGRVVHQEAASLREANWKTRQDLEAFDVQIIPVPWRGLRPPPNRVCAWMKHRSQTRLLSSAVRSCHPQEAFQGRLPADCRATQRQDRMLPSHDQERLYPAFVAAQPGRSEMRRGKIRVRLQYDSPAQRHRLRNAVDGSLRW